VLFASDFDQAMFRSGLLNLHLEEQSLLENQNDEERKNDAFFFSADWGDLEALRSLLQNGANPAAVDDKGTSALMIASGKGHIAIMRHLLTYPIDINATDTDSQSALTWAAAHGYLSACRLLLENGARLN
jgi:ankyrin repeat protein